MSLLTSVQQITDADARRCAEHFCKPGKQIGNGPWYSVQCPEHDDESGTSLGITYFVGKDGVGRVKFLCHAGCDWKPIEDRAIAAGILPKWEPPKAAKSNKEYKSWDKIYAYRDETGATLYEKLRRKDDNGKKEFAQRQPDGQGGWFWHLRGTRKIPYNLPELLAQAKNGGLVLLLEGEKDCDNAVADGFVASCNFDGGGKWKDDLTQYFRGARVVLIPDNDYVGYSHLNLVGASFAKAGLTLHWLELPGSEEKGDYSDWRELCDVQMFQSLLESDIKEWKGPVANPFEKPIVEKVVHLPRDPHAWTLSENVVELYADKPIVRDLEGLTHSGNALRMLAKYSGLIRCSKQEGWRLFDGRSFHKDEVDAVREMAKQVAREMISETDIFRAEDLTKHITKSLDTPGVSNTVKSAASMEGIRCHVYDFDKDVYLLNCQDGVLNLRTGVLALHHPKYMCSQIAACGFDEKFFATLKEYENAERKDFNELLLEEIPSWMNVMTWVCGLDFELFDYLHELAGYCLTGDTSEQQAFFIHGEGQNLKSTYIDTIANMLGGYARTVRAEMFMKRHGPESQQDNFSQLVNIRLAAVQEINADDKLDEAKVKVFTGKTDRITARFLTHEPFDYENKAKALFRANHLPTIVSTDKGIWRRVKNIPFYNTVPDDQVLKGFDEELRSEWSKLCALFTFYLQRKLARGKLVDPKVVTSETEEYRNDMDSFGLFLDIATNKERDAISTLMNLRQAYDTVADELRLPKLGIQRFGLELKKRGFRKLGQKQVEKVRTYEYQGLSLKDEYLPKPKGSRYATNYYNGEPA